jgi:two-component SAPR family response regulator
LSTNAARILIVEPDFIIAESLTILLINKGYLAESAHTASEAIEMAASSKPDLLIIEPHLENEMEGVAVGNTVLSFSPHTEIIFSSAWDLKPMKKFSFNKPCELISKPYDDEELLRIIDKCLADFKSRSSNEQFFF